MKCGITGLHGRERWHSGVGPKQLLLEQAGTLPCLQVILCRVYQEDSPSGHTAGGMAAARSPARRQILLVVRTPAVAVDDRMDLILYTFRR